MKITAEIKLRHGILREAVSRYGTAIELAKAVGVGYQTMCTWLSMVRCPTPGQYTRWYTKEIETKLVEVCGYPIEQIFPPELKAATELFKKQPRVRLITKELDHAALVDLTDRLNERNLLEDPIEIANRHELTERVKALLPSLSYRERIVIDLRFGLDDGVPLTLEEVGHVLKITQGRVRQIEGKAMRQLQQPSRSMKLVEFIDAAPPPDMRVIDGMFADESKRTLREKYEGRKMKGVASEVVKT